MRALRLLPFFALLAGCGPGVSGSDGDDEPCDDCVCVPGTLACDGHDVVECDGDGQLGDVVETCADDQVCSSGQCMSACAQAERERSNVGCEYWAVDLDNEYSQFNDAAAEQFAIALANTSGHAVSVTVEQNDAEPGAPRQLSTVATATIQPDSLTVIELPRREVDGSLLGQGEGPGTMLSSRAYRVRTDFPVVAYQFNPIVQSFSNGASLLIPTSGLDGDYHVLGWPTANPIAGPFQIPGIPDHSFVTVVGVDDAPVNVEVRLGGPIVGGGGIPASETGMTIEVELGAFDVLNLESDGIPGDLTGTRVTADGPIAVFSGGERGIVPYDVMPPAPTDWDGDVCCTEHFEQQVFPRSALGMEFVTTRSPIRSTSATNPEADVWRVLATAPNTVVTTSLPAPYDRFELTTDEHVEFWSTQDFVLSATRPVMVAQYLVSQQYVESPDVGGDPEFIVFPPAEQYRTEYIFLAPPTFDRDWCVIAAPRSAAVQLDGVAIGELSGRCTVHDAGSLNGVDHVAYRCRLDDGVHKVRSDLPVGVTVYGYYNVGSYGYPAGAKVERINVD
jgi:hypothetical protein